PGVEAAAGMFRLQREAGAIVMQGSLARGGGKGTFNLFLSSAYADELQRRGVGRPSRDQQVLLALDDGRLDLLDVFKTLGYPTPNVDMYLRCVLHGVSSDYVHDMVALEYKLASIDEWVKARDHGVDAEFVSGMGKAGYP